MSDFRTLDDIGLDVSRGYARATQLQEEIDEIYATNRAHLLPYETSIVDLRQRLSAIEVLVGIVRPEQTPFAMVLEPEGWNEQRSKAFTISQIAPKLGTADKQMELSDMVLEMEAGSPAQKKQQKMINDFFDKLTELNDIVSVIWSKVGQFLQA